MRRTIILVSAAVLLAAAVSCTSKYADDPYLRDLKIEEQTLAPVDSSGLDVYGYWQPMNVVDTYGGWLVISSVDGDYHMLFVNPESGDHFYAIRRGRGPGEIVSGCNLHKSGDAVRYYDFTRTKCIELDIEKSIAAYAAVCDTVGDFSKGNRLVYLTSCGKDQFVSGCLADENYWYALYDRQGNFLSGIEAIAGLSKDRDSALSAMLSTQYAASPDGKHLCSANVNVPVVSFASVSGNMLWESKRLQAKFDCEKEAHGRTAKSYFNGVAADDNYVYILYSGRRIIDREMLSNECSHLLVYDWNGNIKHHYVLSRPVCSISLTDDGFYAVSTWPSGKLLHFVLAEVKILRCLKIIYYICDLNWSCHLRRF